MNPLKYAQMMKYLTRAKKANPDLPDVTFANKITQPPVRQDVEEIEAINRFMRANPRTEKAGGGRIGFKKKGFVNKGGEAEYQRRLKIAQDKFGKDNLDKAAKELGYKDYDALRGEKFANTRRKIFRELRDFGSALPEKESRSRSRVEKRIPKEQGIQIKLIEATNQNKFFDPKTFAKANNISMATLKDQAKRLQTNIYKKRIVEASREIGKETKDKLDWIPNDPKFSDNALNKLWKSKLIKYERNKIDELFFDAFGRKTSDKYNPKKFLAIKKNLNEYRQLRDAINVKYPNINFELDHPLSKSSLNKLFNATTDQLTRVNVLEADLNNGFKDSLSLQYEKAIQGNNLNKKKAVEKIARDLKLNIGKISDDATNFKYGVKEFQKLNIKDEIVKSLENLSSLNKNFQDYAKKNPELFKTAGVSTQQTFTQIDKKTEADILKMMGFKCKFAGSNGGAAKCDDPASYVDDINKTRSELNSSDVAVRAAANAKLNKGLQVAKTLPTIGKFLRRVGQATVGGVSKALQATGLGTPVGLAIEGMVEGGIYDYYRGQGYTHDQAYQETFFPGIITGREEGVPWYGGAESLLEKELIGDPQQNPKVAQYVSALKDQEQIYDAFADKERGIKAQRKDITDAASADIQDAFRSGMVSRVNQIMNPESMASQAYQTAVEKQIGAQDQRARDYKAENFVQTEPSDFAEQQLQKERNKAMLEMFPPPTVDTVRDAYTAAGYGDSLKFFSAQDYKDKIKDFDDYQKQSYFADNFRLEKAGGGIAKLAGVSSGVAPVRGPNPQGLLSLKNRVRNY